MQTIKERLWALQNILGPDHGPATSQSRSPSQLREGVPPQVLARFDQMLARGKRPVAAVRHGVCSACHLRIPTADLVDLVSSRELRLCGNCGRYLYLSEEEALASLPSLTGPKPAGRKAAAVRESAHA
jgi:hypothetical protein